jgi:O-antigen/teichoic acid export membrane protein
MKLADLRGPVVSALRWTVVSRMVMQLITWSSTIIAVRLLTPTDYGIVTVATVFSNYLQLLGEAGLGSALVQRQIRDRPTLRAVFSVLLALSILLAGAVLSLAPLIGSVFREPRAIPVMRVVALAFISLPFLTLSDSVLRIDMRFKELGIANIVAAVTSAVSVVVLALAGAGPYALVGSYLLGLIAQVVAMQWYARAPLTVTLSLGPVRKLLRYSTLLAIDRSVAFWYREADYPIVARFSGAGILGAFSVAKNFVQMPLDRIGGIANGVFFPTYALIQEHGAVVSEAFLKSLRMASYVFFPLFWGLGAVAEPLVAVAFGEKWRAAVMPMQLLAIPLPLRALKDMSQPLARAVGKPGTSLTISAIAVVIIIPLQVLGMMHFGVAGVAGAWAVGYPFVFCFVIWLFTRILSVRPSDVWLVLARPVLCALFMTGTVLATVYGLLRHGQPLLQLLAGTGVGAVAYVASVRLIDKRAFGELSGLILSFVRR